MVKNSMCKPAVNRASLPGQKTPCSTGWQDGGERRHHLRPLLSPHAAGGLGKVPLHLLLTQAQHEEGCLQFIAPS